MPINALRMAALQQVQDNNMTAQGVDAALQNIPPEEGTQAVRRPPSEVPSLSFGQRQAIAQPIAQAQAIQDYVPTRTEIAQPPQELPAQQAPATDNSLTAYLNQQAGQNIGRAAQGAYSESMSNSLGQAMDVSSRVSGELQRLGGMSPEQRAQIGGNYGAGLGAAVGNGPVGALIGSSIGALTARGLGHVQSGEQDAARRRQGIVQTLAAAGGISRDLSSTFQGSNLKISDQTRLPNISGNGDRGAFEIDMSNPLSRRSTTVARPLARFIAQGMMNQLDDNGGPVTRSTDQTTGMLVNMFTDGVNNIDDVYARARELSGKLGITQEGMRSFFNANRHRIATQEAKEIKQGLDTLYGT